MDVGVVTFATDLGIHPGDLAAAVERAGFDALFVTEHTHLPVDHGPTPWGAPPGPEYRRTYDPFVTLAVAADRTSQITIGTAVSLVAQHDPIALAKAVATLDHLSGGRVELGVGFGWCRPEVEHHGVPFASRRAVVAEHVAVMRALWQPDPTGFTGATVRIAPSHAHPKPARPGGPPVLLGASMSPRTVRHLVDWADGWIVSDRATTVEDVATVRAALAAAGRDPDDFRVTVMGPLDEPGRFDQLAGAGVHRVLAWLPPGPPDAVLAALGGGPAVTGSRRAPSPPAGG